MRRFHLSRIVALAVLTAGAGVPAALVVAAPPAAAATTYTITDLGSLGGGITQGLAINASGQVTGESALSKTIQVPCEFPTSPNQKTCRENVFHAFLWSNGTITDLGTLGGNDSEGVAINDSGEVVGTSDIKSGTNSFLFDPSNQKLTALSSTIGAAGINDSGQIAGECNELPANPEIFACVVSSNGTVTQLGDTVPPQLADIACAQTVAINNNGQVLADCHAEGIGAPFLGSAAVVWTNGTPTVTSAIGTDTEIVGTALNDNGQVVGISGGDGFLWNNGTITDLGPGFHPAAINDSGVMVGGPLVDSGGTVTNLNTLIPSGSGYQIESATGINDKGQIIANAEDTATGQTHALLLTPS